jgi:hypothetical protein
LGGQDGKLIQLQEWSTELLSGFTMNEDSAMKILAVFDVNDLTKAMGGSLCIVMNPDGYAMLNA